jgi:hypothetical protein
MNIPRKVKTISIMKQRDYLITSRNKQRHLGDNRENYFWICFAKEKKRINGE